MFIFSQSVLDSEWAGHAFRIRPGDMNEDFILKRKYYTTSSRTFVDTSWGGHFAVNPFPQFTRNCDVNHKSVYTGNNVNDPLGEFGGVGRWWDETLNENQQEIHIRAGVVRFNSMFTFFTNFYNVEASILSRRGRATSLFYSLGKGAGYVGTIFLQPFILGAEALNFFLTTPRTKFYYLSPAMHMYWRAVSGMMNTYMVNVGLTSYFEPHKNMDSGLGGDPIVDDYFATADWKEQTRMYGGQFGDRIITRNGGIDVFALSTRAQRLAYTYRKRVDATLNAAMEGVTPENRSQRLREFVENRMVSIAEDGDFEVAPSQLDTLIQDLPGPGGLQANIENNVETGLDDQGLERSYLDMYTEFQFATSYNGQPREPTGLLNDSSDPTSMTSPDVLPSTVTSSNAEFRSIFSEEVPIEGEEEGTQTVEFADTTVDEDGRAFSWLRSMGNAAVGNMQMGAEFVTFRVNNTGTHSESFTNTSGESGLMETINSNSSAARSARFNFGTGGLGDGLLSKVVNAAEETVAGVLDSMKLGGIMALGGSAFVDIQKVYQNSSADMMGTSITVPLRAWSADPWTIAKDIAYPLFCLLALGMPKSTGSQSYDEPFLIETYLRGRSQIREGRVRSISITRGQGDIGWTKDGHALGIDVTLEIEDMSGVVGVPINPSTSRIVSGLTGVAGAANESLGNLVDSVASAFTKSTYSEDNKFGDYMNVLGSVDLHRQINTFQKWKVRMAQTRVQMETWRSPHAAVSIFSDTLPGSILQRIGRPTDRN